MTGTHGSTAARVAEARARLGPIGLWAPRLTRSAPGAAVAVARFAERIGAGALWGGEVMSGTDVFDVHERMLAATSRLMTGTGIANMHVRTAGRAAEQVAALTQRYPKRFLAGFGTSHSELTPAMRGRSPLALARDYVTGVAAGLPVETRPPLLLAALGPRMAAVARDVADGVHTYLVPPEHTARMRAALGPDRLVVPEMAVCFGIPGTVPQAALDHVGPQLAKANYARSARRLGIDPGDTPTAAARLVAVGDAETIAAAVVQHLDAGADHVAVQVIVSDHADLWRLEDEVRAVVDAVTAATAARTGAGEMMTKETW